MAVRGAVAGRRRLLAAAAGGALGAVVGPGAATAAAADPRRGSFRTGDGVVLRWLETGPSAPAAPTLVLVPGWCMPAFIWEAQLTAFGERWRTLAFDPRGQGDSEAPAQGYTADRRADDLHELLAPLGPVVLVGWSLGGLEALHYLHRHGEERLAGLVLVDHSVGEPPAPRAGDFLQRLRADRRAALDRFVRGMFRHPPPEKEIDRIETAALRMPLEGSLALLSYPYPREHWRRLAVGCTRPLAYLVTPNFAAQAGNLQRERPGTLVEVFEHAGHALFVDEAARFNESVRGFVTGLG